MVVHDLNDLRLPPWLRKPAPEPWFPCLRWAKGGKKWLRKYKEQMENMFGRCWKIEISHQYPKNVWHIQHKFGFKQPNYEYRWDIFNQYNFWECPKMVHIPKLPNYGHWEWKCDFKSAPRLDILVDQWLTQTCWYKILDIDAPKQSRICAIIL